MPARSCIVIARGAAPPPWELPVLARLPERFDVEVIGPVEAVAAEPRLRARPVRTLGDRLPGTRLAALGAYAAGDRHLDPEAAFAGADVVHAQELSYWYAADAARHKARFGYRLVVTAWETIPFGETYRTARARTHRRAVLDAADLFLPVSDRAREVLRLEGVPPERLAVCPPGVDLERFAAPAADPPRRHVLLSPGRLVWEKGHQDAVRALAALRRGLVPLPEGADPLLRLVGQGPEAGRLLEHAAELGVGDAVEIASYPFAQMPGVFAAASGIVLASLPMAGGGRHPFDVPRLFWEEQFGYVLVEAMAAGLAIVTTDSGAIREVVSPQADVVGPGDWMAIARALAAGPLSRPPGARAAHDAAVLERLSADAAAARLADAYDRVLA
jgi:glycosyltransferase involved in cell wall biosynthesis